MRIEDFPGIFRTTPFSGEQTIAQKTALSPIKPTATAPTANTKSPDDKAQVCFFYQKGTCKYGKNCKNLHVSQATDSNPERPTGRLNDIKKRRDAAPNGNSTPPFQMSNLAKSDNDFMSSHATTASTFDTSDTEKVQHQIDLATTLPQASDIPAKQIAINASGHRLDSYISPPTSEDFEAFKKRTAKQKLCNNYHVNGHCPLKASDCPFDHKPASPGVINALKQIVFSNPCPRKGNCRRTNCLYGHVCQWADCGYRGGKGRCKFSRNTHGEDLNVAEYVEGEQAPPSKKRTPAFEHGSGASTPAEGSTSGSGWKTTRITEPSSGWRAGESEGEPEDEEGALLDLGDGASLD